MVQVRHLINVTDKPIYLEDFNGMTIEAGETVDGLQFGEEALRNSLEVIHAITMFRLKVYDGTYEYEGERAISLIKGTPTQLTKDGKAIITTSDRPLDHYRYFTTCGDDLSNQKRGEGACLLFSVPPTEQQAIDVRFMDDLYLKDGTMIYSGAEHGSWLRVDVLAPAGYPMPAKDKNGNFDVVDGQLVANPTNTGQYFVSNTDTTVHRFINKMAMYALTREREDIDTTEPNFIPKGWIVRLSVHNHGDSETIKAAITLGMYRKITL